MSAHIYVCKIFPYLCVYIFNNISTYGSTSPGTGNRDMKGSISEIWFPNLCSAHRVRGMFSYLHNSTYRSGIAESKGNAYMHTYVIFIAIHIYICTHCIYNIYFHTYIYVCIYLHNYVGSRSGIAESKGMYTHIQF